MGKVSELQGPCTSMLSVNTTTSSKPHQALLKCQPVCLPVYGLKGHHERASTSSLGSMYVLD
ncbi:TPA: hypothetical protein ACH3X2_000561 [Trebouxia sp. C0005]